MGTLLVLGSGIQREREDDLRAFAQQNKLILLQDSTAKWYRRYVHDVLEVPLHDHEAALFAARAMAQKYAFDGVITYSEPFVELAAIIAADLHLPSNSRESAHLCRDKLAMRQAWAQQGVPSPMSYLVTSQEEAYARAQHIGYPVVLKPRALASSISVIRVNSPEELARGYAVANVSLEQIDMQFPVFHTAARGVLIEEYLEGPEISVESIVVAGNVNSVAITPKRLGAAPYFDEVAFAISPEETVVEAEALCDLIPAAHRALNVEWGATHAEVRLTPKGPRMIELGSRLGGAHIPTMVRLATGIDLAGAAAEVAQGIWPTLHMSCTEAAALRYLFPEYAVRVKNVHFHPDLFKFPWIYKFVCSVIADQVVQVPPHAFNAHLGFAIVTGKTIAECEAHLDHVFRLMRFELEPLER